MILYLPNNYQHSTFEFRNVNRSGFVYNHKDSRSIVDNGLTNKATLVIEKGLRISSKDVLVIMVQPEAIHYSRFSNSK